MPPSLLRDEAPDDGALGADASRADGPDLVSLYLREISRIPRLTPDEEQALAPCARAGDETARHRLVEANLRLVVAIARRYLGRGLPLLDLIQEGNLGLFRATQTFDARGARFATYAGHWVRATIVRALDNQARLIRLPAYVSALWRSAGPAAGRLSHQLGRAATIEEVAEAIEVPVAQLREIQEARQWPVSLDSPLDGDEDDDRKLYDVIADQSTVAEDEEESPIEACVAELIEGLDERQRVVIRFRFGFEGQGGRERPSPRGRDDGFTLQEVADRLGCSPMTVHRIEEQALTRLRKLSVSHGAAIAS